jgi:ribosomal protein S27AE
MMLPDNVKDAEIRFRVPAWLKDDFLRHCRLRDVPASHLLRRFIRAAVNDQGPSLADDVRLSPTTAYDCPRCGSSELVASSDGRWLCPACRLAWQTIPSELVRTYADRLGGKP